MDTKEKIDNEVNLDERSAQVSGQKWKQGVSGNTYGTHCIFCDPKCDITMGIYHEHNPRRHGYFNLPSIPTPMENLKCKPKGAQQKSREMKT